jgi:hypothetical protein
MIKVESYDPIPYEGVDSSKRSHGRIVITCDNECEYRAMLDEIMKTKDFVRRFK